jgi:hypothetical protein
LRANDPARDEERTGDLEEGLHRALWRLAFPAAISPPPLRIAGVEDAANFAEAVCHRCNGGLVPRLPHDPTVLNQKWNLAREYILAILLENGITYEQPWWPGDPLYLQAVTKPELQSLVQQTWIHSPQAGVNQHHRPFWEWVDRELEEQFPHAPWWKRYQGEELLHGLVVQAVPNMQVFRNRRFDWMNGRELDIYIPELHLAFEFNGQQHYQPVEFFGGETKFKRQQELDDERRRMCADNGIHLIEVRWDEKLTAKKVRAWIMPFLEHQ